MPPEITYIILGLIFSIIGTVYLITGVLNAYKESKNRIELDFTLSQKYEPKKGFSFFIILLLISLTGIFYVLILTLLYGIADKEYLPATADIFAKFIFLAGLTSLIVSIAKRYYGVEAAREIAYCPRLPEEIKNERDPSKRRKMFLEFIEKNELNGNFIHFGKYMIFYMLPDTLNVYVLLMSMLLASLTRFLVRGEARDLSMDLSSMLFASGVLYVILCIPMILSMKKSSEIPMSVENFPRKILIASMGSLAPIIGLMFVFYHIIQIP